MTCEERHQLVIRFIGDWIFTIFTFPKPSGTGERDLVFKVPPPKLPSQETKALLRENGG